MPPWDYRTSTTGYYDRYATEFSENTFTVDVSALYIPFLREIPEGGGFWMRAADRVGIRWRS